MAILLESEGYKVETARSAEEALSLIAENRYDLVLSDYALPGRSGSWLLQEASARQLLEPSHGMLITASPNPHDAAEFEVIHKPLDFEAFLVHLREHLRLLRTHAVVRARSAVRTG
jgi:CheY-like chemotaxis protein